MLMNVLNYDCNYDCGSDCMASRGRSGAKMCECQKTGFGLFMQCVLSWSFAVMGWARSLGGEKGCAERRGVRMD